MIVVKVPYKGLKKLFGRPFFGKRPEFIDIRVANAVHLDQFNDVLGEMQGMSDLLLSCGKEEEVKAIAARVIEIKRAVEGAADIPGGGAHEIAAG